MLAKLLEALRERIANSVCIAAAAAGTEVTNGVETEYGGFEESPCRHPPAGGLLLFGHGYSEALPRVMRDAAGAWRGVVELLTDDSSAAAESADGAAAGAEQRGGGGGAGPLTQAEAAIRQAAVDTVFFSEEVR